MSFNFEQAIVLVLKSSIEEPPIMRDPVKEKQKDHRKRSKGFRYGKERKSERKMFYRSFRNKSNQFCRKLIGAKVDEIDYLIEPVFKKTSGSLTW